MTACIHRWLTSRCELRNYLRHSMLSSAASAHLQHSVAGAILQSIDPALCLAVSSVMAFLLGDSDLKWAARTSDLKAYFVVLRAKVFSSLLLLRSKPIFMTMTH